MTAATTQIERPQRVYAEFWPANVLMPDGTIRRRVRAYLTDTGVHLFFTKPVDELAPGWSAPIDFDVTDPPDLHAFNVGVDIKIQDELEGAPIVSLLVITPTGGCGCGNTLKSWRPSWSHEVSPWPSS